MLGTYKQTVAPTTQAVSLDDVKRHCSVDGTNDYDELLSDILDAATEAVQQHTERQINSATWTLTLPWFPDEIKLMKPPVTSVSSIAYYDTSGTLQTLSSAYYQTDMSSLDAPARIKPAYGYNWPSTFGDTYNAVVVTFVCGYSSVPPVLKHAILFLAAHWFRNRESVVVGTISSDLPQGIEMLLSLGDWGMYA